MKRHTSTLVVLLAILLAGNSAIARCLEAGQDEAKNIDPVQPEVAPRRRAVDLVVLKDGRRVFGVFLRPPKAGEDHALVVSSEWLSAMLPKDWQQIQRQWTGVTEATNRERLTQIAAFRSTLRKAGQLTQELEVFLDDSIAPPPERGNRMESPRLVQLTIDAQLVQQVLVQPNSRRQLAVIAMSNAVSSVETRDYLELSGEVRKNELRPRSLSLPGADADAAAIEFERWKAFARFEFLDQKNLVQFGEMVYDRDADIPTETLLAELLRRQTQVTIRELLSEASGRPVQNPGMGLATDDGQGTAAARRKAEETGAMTFVLQRLRMSPQQFGGTVDLALFAHAPGTKNWKTVWETSVKIDPGLVTPLQKNELADNPQLKDLSGILDQLGVDNGAVGRSFEYGAAVQTAIADADQQFLRERDRVLFQNRSRTPEIRRGSAAAAVVAATEAKSFSVTERY